MPLISWPSLFDLRRQAAVKLTSKSSIDGMEMSVYDEKSDFDNPFVEPLFDVSIYKAKVRQESEDLIVKTKAMKFVIRLDDEVKAF